MNKTDYISSKLLKNVYYTATTYGTSMLPMLRDSKDQVIIEPVDNIKKFDVVLYRSPNNSKYLLHRVINFKGNMCIIRGDNLFYKEQICKTDIIGKMTYFMRGKKHFSVKSLPYKTYCIINVYSYPVRFFARTVKDHFTSLCLKIKSVFTFTNKKHR